MEQLKNEHQAILQVLPQDVRDKLLKKFNEVEEKKIGKGKHEEFHRMIDRLKKVYL